MHAMPCMTTWRHSPLHRRRRSGVHDTGEDRRSQSLGGRNRVHVHRSIGRRRIAVLSVKTACARLTHAFSTRSFSTTVRWFPFESCWNRIQGLVNITET